MVESVGTFVPDAKWTDEDTERLIKWRTVHNYLFSGKRSSARNGWEAFIRENQAKLDVKWTSRQAKKKWDNLKTKHKEIKNLGNDIESVNSNTWRWFCLMDQAVECSAGSRVHPKNARPASSDCGDDITCPPQPCKKLCQVQVGGDIYELLANSVIEVQGGSGMTLGSGETASDCVSVKEKKHRHGKDVENDTRSEIATNTDSLKKEKLLLEKEHAEVDRERVILEKERDLTERVNTVLQRDRAQLEKDRAALDRDRASLEQERARIEKDRAALERDRATLERDKDRFMAMVLGRNSAEHIDTDPTHREDRKRLIFLFERLIERF
ncbi:uncharacterized protein LOC108269375 isoform X2 [Ictalurus punctatus]|uniref:Uncharacterized protein LOC108269375 isoform X2 n=1 Tax=Ictalurus punctatus TaxID=7998 RepID=A0A2D0RJL8_ICTPU|nr:uncharacterized protein LOC108269375 isoform X2 [Ictalurus punctatus]